MAEETRLQEVYSLLLPISGGRLILPRLSIAEVTGYTRPKNRPEDAPEWLLGFMGWQGNEIPMVSFEAACGRPVPELSRRSRIAIIYAIGGRLNPSVFALVTQGYPYLIRVNPGVLQVEAEEQGGDRPVLVQLRIANERPMIPDLEKLEDMMGEALGIAPGSGIDTAHGEDTGIGEFSLPGEATGAGDQETDFDALDDLEIDESATRFDED